MRPAIPNDWLPTGAAPAVVALALMAGAAAAGTEGPDCAAPVTQLDMTLCAEQAWRRADEDLNLAYGFARKMMQDIDAGLPDDQKGAEVALRDAQRAWIAFRDAGCAAEGFRAAGGSMRPMVVALCLERVTRARTEDLRALGETW